MRTRKTGQIVSVSVAALLAWQGQAFAPDFTVPKLPKGHFKLPEFHVPDLHVPEVHAPDVHVPEVHVDVPNVHLPEHLDLGNIHVPEAHIDAPHLNAGDLDAPHINYEQLPPNPSNYVQLPGERPTLNYANLPPEPNNVMGKLPPAYDKVPELPRPLPHTPGSGQYGALPSDPPITAAKPFRPADALGDLVGLPVDHPGRVQANKITANVGVPTPVARTPVGGVRRLPAPQVLAEVAQAAPLQAPTAIKQGMKLRTKIVIGATVTTVGLVAIGVSLPAIVKKISGEDLPDTGNAEVDSAVKALTPP